MVTPTRSGASGPPARMIWLLLTGLIVLAAWTSPSDGLASPVDCEEYLATGQVVPRLHLRGGLESNDRPLEILDATELVCDPEDPDPDFLEAGPRRHGSFREGEKRDRRFGLATSSVLDILVLAPKQGPPHSSSL